MESKNKTESGWWVGVTTDERGDEALAVWPANVQDGEQGAPVCKVSPLEFVDEQDLRRANLIAHSPELFDILSRFMGHLNFIYGKRLTDFDPQTRHKIQGDYHVLANDAKALYLKIDSEQQIKSLHESVLQRAKVNTNQPPFDSQIIGLKYYWLKFLLTDGQLNAPATLFDFYQYPEHPNFYNPNAETYPYIGAIVSAKTAADAWDMVFDKFGKIKRLDTSVVSADFTPWIDAGLPLMQEGQPYYE